MFWHTYNNWTNVMFWHTDNNWTNVILRHSDKQQDQCYAMAQTNNRKNVIYVMTHRQITGPMICFGTQTNNRTNVMVWYTDK